MNTVSSFRKLHSISPNSGTLKIFAAMSQSDLAVIDRTNVPSHIGIIMDGNGRWAQNKGLERIFGHKKAVQAVREATEGCAELGVKYLTLYAFSTENWSRPRAEVNALMQLLVNSLKSESETLCKNNIRLNAIGQISTLPLSCQKSLQEAIESTAHCDGMILSLALSYSGRSEILDAVKKVAQDVLDNKISVEGINVELFSSYLHTVGIPDPELVIRTSGEMRISNFLLWQIAYAELTFIPVLWPDFRKSHLYEAIASFQNRERRFGKTGEQIKK